MVRIAIDLTPFNDSVHLLDFPDLAARLGYEYLQLTPNPDFGRHFHHPKVDSEMIAALRKRASDAGVTITSVQPVQRFGGPDPRDVERAVFHATRYIEVASELGAPVINTEFSGRPEREEESEYAFYRTACDTSRTRPATPPACTSTCGSATVTSTSTSSSARFARPATSTATTR